MKPLDSQESHSDTRISSTTNGALTARINETLEFLSNAFHQLFGSANDHPVDESDLPDVLNFEQARQARIRETALKSFERDAKAHGLTLEEYMERAMDLDR